MALNTNSSQKKNHYAGRGKFAFGLRNSDGSYGKILFARNTSGLEISMGVERRDHFESETGENLLDASFVNQKTAELRATIDSIDTNSATVIMGGNTIEIPARNNKTYTITEDVKAGDTYLLPDVNLATGNNVSITADGVAIVEGTDYSVDRKFGTITFITNNDGPVVVTYDTAATKATTAFSLADTNEYYAVYLAANKANNGKRVRWDLYRVQFDPSTAIQLAGDDFGTFEVRGRLLVDEIRDPDPDFGRFARAIWVDDPQ